MFFLANIAHSYDVTENQVTFFLSNREQNSKVQLTDQNLSLLNSSKPTRFLVHGWTGSHNTTWFAEATEAYLFKGDYNVIQVDWSEPASEEFYVSANNTKAVGMHQCFSKNTHIGTYIFSTFIIYRFCNTFTYN